MNENKERLKSLLVDVLLLTPEEFSFTLSRSEISTWDSLAVVSIAVGVEEVFGYHMSPDQAVAVDSVTKLISILGNQGITFDE